MASAALVAEGETYALELQHIGSGLGDQWTFRCYTPKGRTLVDITLEVAASLGKMNLNLTNFLDESFDMPSLWEWRVKGRASAMLHHLLSHWVLPHQAYTDEVEDLRDWYVELTAMPMTEAKDLAKLVAFYTELGFKVDSDHDRERVHSKHMTCTHLARLLRRLERRANAEVLADLKRHPPSLREFQPRYV